jgi:hypothetical protein
MMILAMNLLGMLILLNPALAQLTKESGIFGGDAYDVVEHHV